MKVRLGALTGELLDGAGCYFSLDGTREGVVGLASLHYGVSSGKKGAGGKVVQIWPAVGSRRVVELRLGLSRGLREQVDRFRLATRDFTCGGGYLRLRSGGRLWRRDAVKSDISWRPGSGSVVFHNNTGPFADTLLQGDFVELEVGMAGWTDTMKIERTLGELTLRHTFQPVSTCDVYLAGRWFKRDVPGAAGVKEGDAWVRMVQAYSKKKGKKGGRKYYNQEASVRGLAGGPYTAWLYGEPGGGEIRVTYPAAALGLNAKILFIYVN